MIWWQWWWWMTKQFFLLLFSLCLVVCAFPQPFVPPPEHLPLHRRTHKKKHFHGTKKLTNEAGYNCTTGNEEARATEWMVWHILKLETKNCFVFFKIVSVLYCTVTLPPLKDNKPVTVLHLAMGSNHRLVHLSSFLRVWPILSHIISQDSC